MAFSTKRGRPKKNLETKDLGTKELQEKRKYNLTTEPLDIIFKKDLITEDQYRAGNRLRFLYSLKYGIAAVTAYDHSQIAGRNVKRIDLIWLSEREAELEKALTLLRSSSAYDLICDICIFLKYSNFKYQGKFPNHIYIEEIEKFREGLDILSNFFSKKKVSYL